jgi:DNA topoisomerase IA
VKVCIAEKPSVAKEIARILQANNRKDGYFEGNGYQITWTFGCSEYKGGCTFKVLFEQYGKVLNDKQVYTLIQKGKSPKIKGLSVNGKPIDSVLILDSSFNVKPE